MKMYYPRMTARATDWHQTDWSKDGSYLTPEDCGQKSKGSGEAQLFFKLLPLKFL